MRGRACAGANDTVRAVRVWIDLTNSPHVLVMRPVIDLLREEISDALADLKPKEPTNKISEIVRTAMRRVFREELGKKPVLDVHVIKV